MNNNTLEITTVCILSFCKIFYKLHLLEKGDIMEAVQKLVSYGFILGFSFLISALIAVQVVNAH
jgi:hypothetical protein